VRRLCFRSFLSPLPSEYFFYISPQIKCLVTPLNRPLNFKITKIIRIKEIWTFFEGLDKGVKLIIQKVTTCLHGFFTSLSRVVGWRRRIYINYLSLLSTRMLYHSRTSSKQNVRLFSILASLIVWGVFCRRMHLINCALNPKPKCLEKFSHQTNEKMGQATRRNITKK
jgi:hypothetical protein